MKNLITAALVVAVIFTFTPPPALTNGSIIGVQPPTNTCMNCKYHTKQLKELQKGKKSKKD